jgi:hypothetical protein
MDENSPAHVSRSKPFSWPVDKLPPKLRSAASNTLKLGGVDGRSALNRRFRDAALALAADLGGWDGLTEAQRVQIRQAATLSVQIEQLQAKMLATEPTVGQTEALSRLANIHRRTLTTLKASAPARKQMTVLEYLTAKQAAADDE